MPAGPRLVLSVLRSPSGAVRSAHLPVKEKVASSNLVWGATRCPVTLGTLPAGRRFPINRRRASVDSVCMRVLRSILLGALMLALWPAGSVGAGTPPEPWHPLPGAGWQWQLSGTVDQSVNAEVYNVDLFENGAGVVSDLHAAGRKVICYMSAGSFERWRSDAASFPSGVKGEVNGWPGERWLDIRRLGVLKPIMRARLDMCRARGYDGVEFDNVDGYANRTGFPLTGADQRAYNEWLAQAAHARGLAAGLKNDLAQIVALEPHFDFAVNEQCFQYRECSRLAPFIENGKAVFHVEYVVDPEDFCPRTTGLGFSSLRKRWALGAWRIACS